MATGTELFFLKKAVDLISLLASELLNIRSRREAEISRIEKTFGDLDYLVPFYVMPDAQNVNPADFDEDDTGLIAKNDVFDLLDRFLAGPKRYSHAFVLSDAGMGKTSLLVMLKLFHLGKFIEPKYDVQLFKLGPETIGDVLRIASPKDTILLLDALDEDQEAWESFYNRMQFLLKSTSNFRKVIITCRTQFFPIEHEEDGKVPGVVTLSGFQCSKIFLSPFSNDQVDDYILKRFDSGSDRSKVREIVSRMDSLKFRPMLLSYVDYFLDSTDEFHDAYSVYEVLVEEWLNRELRKGVIEDKLPIFEACTNIAIFMYRDKRREIEFGEVRENYLSVSDFKSLEYMTIEGRSLLQRNSEGNFKFAHYSILEYFVARKIVNSPERMANTDQVVRFIEDLLRNHGQKVASGLDLTSIRLNDAALTRVDFSDSIISQGTFSGSNFSKSNLTSIVATSVDLSKCNFAMVDFSSSENTLCNYSDSNLQKANLDHAFFEKCDLMYVDFSKAKLRKTQFIESDLSSCVFKNVVSENSKFNLCTMHNVKMYDDCSFETADFSSSRFRGANLNGVRFSECNGSDIHCIDTTIQNAEFVSSKFNGSNFDYSTFNGTNLIKINFNECKFGKVTFDNGSINNCNFRHSSLQACSFNTSDICDTDFSESRWGKVELQNSKISNVQFRETIGDSLIAYRAEWLSCDAEKVGLNSSNFSETKMVKVKFNFSELPKALFNSTFMKDVQFRRCDLQRAKFINSELSSVDFKGSDLSGSNFENASLSDVDLSNTILDAVDFTGVNVERLKIQGARYSSKTKWGTLSLDLTSMLGPKMVGRGLDLKNRDLMSADLEGSDLTGSDFSGNNLSNSNFKGATLERCNFSASILKGADLSDANLRKCRFVGCDLRGAQLGSAAMHEAIYSPETKFPTGFDPRAKGMRGVSK